MKRQKFKSMDPLAPYRRSDYCEAYLVPRLRRKAIPSEVHATKSDDELHLVVEAAKQGDYEAACAMFLELWVALINGRKPASAIVEYFDPIFLELALSGMCLAFGNDGDSPIANDLLPDLFNLKRKSGDKNKKRAGELPGKTRSRDLWLRDRIEEKTIEVIERDGAAPDDALEQAFVELEEDLENTPSALKHDQLRRVYESTNPLYPPAGPEENPVNALRGEYISLKRRLARLKVASQNTN